MKAGLVKAFLYAQNQKNMERKLSEKNFIAIADWMLDLDLNTRELLTYALIYSFSQDGKSCYYGSLEYLSKWLGINDRTNAVRYLKPLVEKGLVAKKDIRTRANQKGCLYIALIDKGPVINNPEIDYIIIQPWMLKDLHLNGKDLLLYALVHGYSRRESGNVCSYNRDYFSKWLQCQKNNVRRQVDRMIEKGLIVELNKKELSAVVPDVIKKSQIDNTPKSNSSFDDFDWSQIDNTSSHSDNTGDLKLTTDNLDSYNLKDNQDHRNNNTADFQNIVYGDKESLSVVVNRRINFADLVFDSDREAFACKQILDFAVYSQFRNKKTEIDLISLLQKRSEILFGMLLAEWPADSAKYRATDILLFSTIYNRRFSKRANLINDLSAEEIRSLFIQTYDLFDPNHSVEIRKSREAYMIGVLENILERKTAVST